MIHALRMQVKSHRSEENTYSSAEVYMHTSHSPITFQLDTTNKQKYPRFGGI